MTNKTDKYKDVTIGEVIQNIIDTTEQAIIYSILFISLLPITIPKWLDKLFWCVGFGMVIIAASYLLNYPPWALQMYSSRLMVIVIGGTMGTVIYALVEIFERLTDRIASIVVYRKKIQEDEVN